MVDIEAANIVVSFDYRVSEALENANKMDTAVKESTKDWEEMDSAVNRASARIRASINRIFPSLNFYIGLARSAWSSIKALTEIKRNWGDITSKISDIGEKFGNAVRWVLFNLNREAYITNMATAAKLRHAAVTKLQSKELAGSSLTTALFATVAALLVAKAATVAQTMAQFKQVLITKLATLWSYLYTAGLWVYTAATKVATAATLALGVATNIALWPIVLIIMAIVGAILLVILIWQNWEKIAEAVSNAWNQIISFLGDAWNTIVEGAKAIWDGLVGIFTGLWDGLVAIWNGIVNGLKAAWEGLASGAKAIWDGIVNTITGAINGIVTAIESGINFIIDMANKAIEAANYITEKVGISLPKIPSITLEGMKLPTAQIGAEITGTGALIAHKGETVVPAADVAPYKGGGRPINITVNNTFNLDATISSDIDVRDLTREIADRSTEGILAEVSAIF